MCTYKCVNLHMLTHIDGSRFQDCRIHLIPTPFQWCFQLFVANLVILMCVLWNASNCFDQGSKRGWLDLVQMNFSCSKTQLPQLFISKHVLSDVCWVHFDTTCFINLDSINACMVSYVSNGKHLHDCTTCWLKCATPLRALCRIATVETWKLFKLSNMTAIWVTFMKFDLMLQALPLPLRGMKHDT